MKTSQAMGVHAVLASMMAAVGIPGIPSAAGDHLPVWSQIVLQVLLIGGHLFSAYVNSNTGPDGKKL